MQSAGEEEEITMVEMPQELDASQASTSSHSPDLFDEKSNDSAQGDRPVKSMSTCQKASMVLK